MATTPEAFERVALSSNERRTLLTPLEVARGVLAMRRNGRRLLHDGLTLLEQARYPSSIMLAILAHEEVGKAVGMGLHAVIDHDGGLRRLWSRGYESHAHKNLMSAMVVRAQRHFAPPENESTSDLEQEAAEDFVRIRERATYVDCVQGHEAWSVPELVVGRDEALRLLQQVFEAMRRYQMPSQVVGQVAEVWAQALEAKSSLTTSEQEELLRARQAMVWASTESAIRIDAVDREEGTMWNQATQARLSIVAA